MNDKLVTVIIPVHNRFELARETIISVVGQTYRPIEIIIVDDASAKPFQISVEDQQGLSLRILRSDENIGPGAARELGRQEARGEFIAYLDSDDLWHKNKIAVQVKMLLDNQSAGMCYCSTKNINCNSGELGTRAWSDKKVTQFLPVVLFWRPWSTSACLWTRQSTEKIGPWFPGFDWEDVEYDVRAGCNDIEIVFVPEFLCFYRKDGTERLNARPLQDKLKAKFPTMYEVAKNLYQCGKQKDLIVKGRLIYDFYSMALHSIACQENPIFVEAIKTIHKYTTWYDAAWWGAHALLFLNYLPIKPAIVIRGGKFIRRHVFPENIHSYYHSDGAILSRW